MKQGLIPPPTPSRCGALGGSDLNRLPNVLKEKISTGRYRTEAVGACGSGNRGQGFTTYRLAVLLF
jgi:hypothetical protein